MKTIKPQKKTPVPKKPVPRPSSSTKANAKSTDVTAGQEKIGKVSELLGKDGYDPARDYHVVNPGYSSPSNQPTVPSWVPGGFDERIYEEVQAVIEGKDPRLQAGTNVTPIHMVDFLRDLATSGSVIQAIGRSPYSSKVWDKLKSMDPRFSEKWDKALERHESRMADILQTELFRRAVLGVDEAVYYCGKVVGYRKVYSDSLFTLMIKAHLPRYKDKAPAADPAANALAAASTKLISLIDSLLRPQLAVDITPSISNNPLPIPGPATCKG